MFAAPQVRHEGTRVNNLGFGLTITAEDLASAVIGDVEKSFFGFEKSAFEATESLEKFGIEMKASPIAMGVFLAGAAAVTQGLAGLTGAFGLAMVADSFDGTMNDLAFTAGYTAEQIEKLTRAVKLTAADTGRSVKETASALAELANSGFDADAALSALKPTLDLVEVSAGKLGVAEAARLAAQTLAIFPELGGDVEHAFNVMFNASRRSRTGLDEMTQALDTMARSVPHGLGPFEDLLVVFGSARAQFSSARGASLAVAQALKQFADPKIAEELRKQLGVITKTDQGGFRPLLNTLADVAVQFEHLSEAQRFQRIQSIFGEEAARPLGPLFEELTKRAKEAGGGVQGFATAVEAMRKSMSEGETVADFASALREGLGRTVEQIHNGLGQLAIEAGLAFNHVLTPAVKAAGDAIQALLHLVTELPQGFKDMAAAAFVIGSMALAVAGAAAALAALKTMALVVTPVMAAAAIAFAKVLLVAAALAAVAFVVYSAWKSNFAGVQDVVLPVLEKIGLAIKSLWILVTEGELTGSLAEALVGDGNEGVFAFVQAVSQGIAMAKAIFEGFVSGVVEVFGEVSEAFRPVLEEVMALFQELWAVGMQFLAPIAEILGLPMGKDGIGVLKMIGSLMAKQLLLPAKALLESFAFIVRVLVFMERAIVAVIAGVFRLGEAILSAVGPAWAATVRGFTALWNAGMALVKGDFSGALGFMKEAFFAFVDLLFAPIDALGTFLSDTLLRAWRLVEEAMVKGVNFLVEAINALISGFQKVAFATAPTADMANAAVGALEGLRLSPLEASAAPAAAPAAAVATPAPIPGAGTVASGGDTSGAGRPITAAEMRQIMADMDRRGGRQVVVQGDVQLDGARVGRVLSNEARDASARQGRLAPSIRSGGQ